MYLMAMRKAFQWTKKNLDNVDANVNKKLVKNRHLDVLSQTCGFCFVFLACPLQGGNFYQECPIRTAYLCPGMGGVRY